MIMKKKCLRNAEDVSFILEEFASVTSLSVYFEKCEVL